MKDAVHTRPHIADADYYRIGYQLAAQLLNRAATPVTTVPGPHSGAPPIVNDDALVVARQLLADARTVLAWYGARRRSRLRWRRPSAQEERLRTFLARTVEPCCALIAARRLHQLDRAEEAQRLVDGVLALANAGRLSYRAYYALACLQANTGDSDGAIAYLSRALYDAPRSRRGKLAEWASTDPAFSSIRDAVLAVVPAVAQPVAAAQPTAVTQL